MRPHTGGTADEDQGVVRGGGNELLDHVLRDEAEKRRSERACLNEVHRKDKRGTGERREKDNEESAKFNNPVRKKVESD